MVLFPDGIDDASANVAAMQATADPGEVGTESLATDLRGELQRLRFAIRETKQELDSGINQWYESPTTTVVSSPGSSVDNTLTRFDGTTGGSHSGF